jgi:hypothetical protein
LVGSEKFEAKRSKMKQKFFFSRERAKRMQTGSRFASFRFKEKIFFAKLADTTPVTAAKVSCSSTTG